MEAELAQAHLSQQATLQQLAQGEHHKHQLQAQLAELTERLVVAEGDLLQGRLLTQARLRELGEEKKPGTPLPDKARQPFEALVEDVAAYLREHGSTEHGNVVMGESMGGVVAAGVAMQHPELVSGLILVNPATALSVMPDLQSDVRWMRHGRIPEALFPLALFLKVGYKTFDANLFSSAVRDILVDKRMEKLRAEDPELAAYYELALESLVASISETKPSAFLRGRLAQLEQGCSIVEKQLASLQTPTLVIAGTADALLLSSKEAARLLRTIPICDVHLVEGAGHAGTLNQRIDLPGVVGRWTVCTRLLELCVARGSPRVALHVLEHMAEARGLEVDDYCRLVRLFILRRVSADELARFEETALDLLTFSDDGLHNYFAHVASLLNLELHEVVCRPGGCADAAAAAAALIASGGALTPLVALLLHGMGGREGVQSDAELRELAGASSNLGMAEALEGARARLAELEASAALNASQRAAAEAGLTRRLTLVQGPPGTGKTQLASRLIALWVNELGVRPVLACADSNVAVDHLGLALISLFERMLRAGVPAYLLDTQHRMHPSLASFPSDAFYRGRVVSGAGMAAARPQLRGFAWPRPNVHVAFVPSSAPEEGEGGGGEGYGTSKVNRGEAGTVLGLVRTFLQVGELSAAQIGVVTPYAAQVRLLRGLLRGLPEGRLVECLSVDGFQGREKELILFSAVRSGGRALGFVADARRLNVMLTRARRGLVVVGDPHTLVHSSHWADWLEWVERTGAACAPNGWRCPPRPRVRPRDDDDHAEVELDELGRAVHARPAEADEAPPADPTVRSRAAARREERKRRRLAAAAAEDEAAVRAADGMTAAAAAALSGPPLLPNWYRATDAEGRSYYHNAATLETCWQAPLRAARSVADVAAAEAQRADAAMSRLHEAWVRDGELTPPPQCEA
ncbi:tRNA-splicing endonuclease positive effector [Chrysochromulina tobinii]|uniref:tRNA-splicing endonuclease positive effector n=1 Tax=Chrysochromulina tobinii TaxID=1460289 RepID=A0A0M0JGS3_9EUKA|nr:tRNA-splicing endonuclease positive effector [Chrysochromulina tobinii]|eukprot:KOO25784.1 tRNA-splicing endonuclease positive effector [Chrysochromulina sp. CCMP291]